MKLFQMLLHQKNDQVSFMRRVSRKLRTLSHRIRQFNDSFVASFVSQTVFSARNMCVKFFAFLNSFSIVCVSDDSFHLLLFCSLHLLCWCVLIWFKIRCCFFFPFYFPYLQCICVDFDTQTETCYQVENLRKFA